MLYLIEDLADSALFSFIFADTAIYKILDWPLARNAQWRLDNLCTGQSLIMSSEGTSPCHCPWTLLFDFAIDELRSRTNWSIYGIDLRF